MMVDTGAAFLALDRRYAATLADNGRPRLDGVIVNTPSGPVNASLTRVATISVGEASDVQTPTLVFPADSVFDALSSETGLTIVGLVGGSFLRRGVVAIDYPSSAVVLARRIDQSYLDAHEFIGPGFTLASVSAEWVIATVYPGTPAAAGGLQSGDIVRAIDGTSLAGKSIVEIDAITHAWSVGQVLTVELDRAGTASQVAVSVEDLLPPIP
jgi:hypothetical protein